MKQSYFILILLFIFLVYPRLSFGQIINDSLVIDVKPQFNNKNITENTWFITKNKDSILLKKVIFYH